MGLDKCRVFIGGVGKWVSFVDRAVEVEQLFRLAGRGYAFPIALYGPEGCGKTTLLRCFMELLRSEDYVAVYVDALETRDFSRAVTANIDRVWDAIESIVLDMPIGGSLARYAATLLRRLHERYSLKGKRVILIVDDVYKAIGLEDVDRYTKSLYEWIGSLHRELQVDRVLIILATSEGISKRVLSRHTYVHIYMLWNLPREGFGELVNQLEPPGNIDPESLWILTGGNPRALVEIAQLEWDLEKWLKYIAERRVSPAVHGIDRNRLEMLIENPDADPEAAMILEERGIMIELSRVLTIGSPPERKPDLGVGERWAWQIPAYREAIKRYF